MPTIEIISLNSNKINFKQTDFEVAIIVENKLESHRGLFDNYISQKKGTIIHIGNPESRKDKNGGFFAGKIIDWNAALSENKFQFEGEFKKDINTILEISLTNSNISEIYFLTDYQFGAKDPEFIKIKSISEFWNGHDKEGLNWNTLIEISEK